VFQATEKLSAVKAEIRMKLQQLPSEISFKNFPESLAVIKERVETVTASFSSELQQLHEDQNHLKLAQKLDEFAKALTDDSECPLCGSVHHPKVFSAVSIKEQLQQKQAGINELENKKKLLQDVIINLSACYSKYETFTAQKNLKLQEHDRQKNDLGNHIKSFAFDGYSHRDEELVKKQLADIEGKNNELKKRRKECEEKERVIEEATKKSTIYKTAIDQLQTEKAQQKGRLQTLKEQILIHDVQIETNKQVEELQQNIIAFKSKHQQITRDFEQLIKQRKTISNN
jgi:exonuclease SbcC